MPDAAPMRILICGLNGAGKSTLGIQLAEVLNVPFMDIEDYYFPKDDPQYPYGKTRTQEEASALLLRDALSYSSFVFASVKGNCDQEFSKLLTCAVFIHVPKDICMKRVKERSYQKFGTGILEDGDLFLQEKQFFAMIEKRHEEDIFAYLSALCIPVIHLNGTLPIRENLQRILHALK